MGESMGRISNWVKTHPWVAAVLLGVVVIAAIWYLRNKSSTTTVSQTPSTTDTSGSAAAGATDTSQQPPAPTVIPEPMPVPIPTGFDLGSGGHHGHSGGVASPGVAPTAAPSAFQPATTSAAIPGTFTVLGSEIVAVTNPAEYGAGAVLMSSNLNRAATAAVTGGGGEKVAAGRRTVDTSALALKPGYQSRLAAEYGVKQPTGRTAAVIGTVNLSSLPKATQSSSKEQGKIAGVKGTAKIPKPVAGRGIGSKVKVR